MVYNTLHVISKQLQKYMVSKIFQTFCADVSIHILSKLIFTITRTIFYTKIIIILEILILHVFTLVVIYCHTQILIAMRGMVNIVPPRWFQNHDYVLYHQMEIILTMPGILKKIYVWYIDSCHLIGWNYLWYNRKISVTGKYPVYSVSTDLFLIDEV